MRHLGERGQAVAKAPRREVGRARLKGLELPSAARPGGATPSSEGSQLGEKGERVKGIEPSS